MTTMRVGNATLSPLKPPAKGIVAFRTDRLEVYIAQTPELSAGIGVPVLAEEIRRAVQKHNYWGGILASAPSQDEFAANITLRTDIPWEKATGMFQMDEYDGMSASDKRSFRWYQNRHYWAPLFMAGTRLDPRVIFQMLTDRQGFTPREYAQRLIEVGPMIGQGGIGRVNAHIAFNDPPLADFNDPVLVKKLEIAYEAKWQQVLEGHFARIEDVPMAYTLTIPALTNNYWYGIDYWSCAAKSVNKASAARKMVFDEVSAHVPGTILRTDRVGRAGLYLDAGAAKDILPILMQLEMFDEEQETLIGLMWGQVKDLQPDPIPEPPEKK